MSKEEMLLPYKDYGRVCNVCLKVLGRPEKNPKCTKHLHYLRCGDCERWFPPGSLKSYTGSAFCICSNCISIRKDEEKKRKKDAKLRADLKAAQDRINELEKLKGKYKAERDAARGALRLVVSRCHNAFDLNERTMEDIDAFMASITEAAALLGGKEENDEAKEAD